MMETRPWKGLPLPRISQPASQSPAVLRRGKHDYRRPLLLNQQAGVARAVR